MEPFLGGSISRGLHSICLSETAADADADFQRRLELEKRIEYFFGGSVRQGTVADLSKVRTPAKETKS